MISTDHLPINALLQLEYLCGNIIMTEIVKHNEVDLNKVQYTKPTHKQNAYYGDMLYDKNELYIQSSRMKIIDIKDNKQLVVSVDPANFDFYDFMVSLDDHNLATTYRSSKEWFEKELPMDVLETMYRRISQPFKKGDTPTLEFKLHAPKKKLCQVYDQDNKEMKLDQLVIGDTIIAIVQVGGLKFLKRDYYCDLCISQIKCTKPMDPEPLQGCMITDEVEPERPEDICEFEILDEEVIERNQEKLAIEQQVKVIESTIHNEQQQLHELQEKLKNLN